MYTNKKINAYQKENVKARIASADPYTLITMLMAGCLEHLAKGKGCIERNDLEAKAVHLSKASSIILSLDRSLDAEVGGDIAQNLSALYQYMNERITVAGIELKVEPIDEVIELLREIKSGWDAIPREDVDKTLSMQQQG